MPTATRWLLINRDQRIIYHPDPFRPTHKTIISTGQWRRRLANGMVLPTRYGFKPFYQREEVECLPKKN